MGYEPLHHKYRPQTFADLVGQEAIAATLSNALRLDRIAPAYLFTGARGTGKTSSARIMAKSLNCLSEPKPTPTPCGHCELCHSITRGTAMDITEIDAASNTGVDNIRELIERAQFAPVQARYKVYIIDEVHMLSNAAFNALLKTLEEPPDRITFVLATTDPQRVLPTIISRCQRFDFRRIPLEAMVKHLTHIAHNENIQIHPEAVTLVAQMAQGGLRDAEALLDQLSLLDGEISVDAVWDLVGSVPERDLLGILAAIVEQSPIVMLEALRRVMDRGREPLIVLQNLANVYRDLLIAKTAKDRSDLVAMTALGWAQLTELAAQMELPQILHGQQHLRGAETQLRQSTQPRLWLEVTLMGLLANHSLPVAASSQTPLSMATTAAAKSAPAVSPSPTNIPYNNIAPTNGRSPASQGVTTQATATPNTTQVVPEITPQVSPNPGATVAPPPNNYVDHHVNGGVNSAVDAGNLDQAWQTILNLLSVPSRGVFGGRSQLLTVDLASHQPSVLVGLVGNRDDAMKRIAIEKRSEIEAACQQVWQRRVQVKYKFIAQITPLNQANSVTPVPPPLNSTFNSPLNSEVMGQVTVISLPPQNTVQNTIQNIAQHSAQTNTPNIPQNIPQNITNGGNAPPNAPKPNSQPHNQPPPGPTPPPKNNPPTNLPPSGLNRNLSEQQLSEKNALDNLVRLFQGQVVDLEAIPDVEEISTDALALEEVVLDN